MNNKLQTYLFAFILVVAFPVSAGVDETRLLKYSGSPIEDPFWFKDSFLDIKEDITEAEEQGKKLILYFHQAGCPYCYNFVQQSLLEPKLSPFIQKNFDVVALSLWGDREVTLPDGDVLSEKELAIRWQIQFTPTLIFFDGDDEAVLRIDGYRNKEVTARILDYVLTGNTDESLAQRLIEPGGPVELYPSKRFSQTRDLSKLSPAKPVAILFEYPGCADCEQLHKQVLSRTDSNQLLESYQTVRIDVLDPGNIITPDGKTTTGRRWAEDLGLSFFPSAILLDGQGIERFRVDSYVQAYHFNTALEYVSERIYTRLPEFQRYINERADRLRDAGQEVIITR